jgi:quercetin dioxygenase-like cupin family protein
MTSPERIGAGVCALVFSLCGPAAFAQAPAAPQAPGFTSKPILVAPISGVDARELVLIAVTLEPGASSPPHTHPGDCFGSVTEGAIELRVLGQPARRVGTGEAYAVNVPGVPHQYTNTGNTPVRMLNTLVVEKGKPRTVVVPDPVP